MMSFTEISFGDCADRFSEGKSRRRKGECVTTGRQNALLIVFWLAARCWLLPMLHVPSGERPGKCIVRSRPESANDAAARN